jgi:hypothetical protein
MSSIEKVDDSLKEVTVTQVATLHTPVFLKPAALYLFNKARYVMRNW